jgi:hypothetical protein
MLLRHRLLRPACLPIPPPGHFAKSYNLNSYVACGPFGKRHNKGTKNGNPAGQTNRQKLSYYARATRCGKQISRAIWRNGRITSFVQTPLLACRVPQALALESP